MRIGGKPAARFQLPAEVLDLMRADTPFDKRARVNPRRRVALEVDRVTFKFFRAPAEEVIEADFVERRC